MEIPSVFKIEMKIIPAKIIVNLYLFSRNLRFLNFNEINSTEETINRDAMRTVGIV